MNSNEFIPSSFHVFLVLWWEAGLRKEEYLQLDRRTKVMFAAEETAFQGLSRGQLPAEKPQENSSHTIQTNNNPQSREKALCKTERIRLSSL